MGFLTRDAAEALGFAELGSNVLISDRASFYGTKHIKIASNVRIDDFCVLSAGERGIEIGSYVHIAVGALLIGAGKITLSDFSGISSKVSIYSSSDDYTGEALTNPTIPSKFTKVNHDDVFLGKHVIIGSGSVVLPGVKLEEGVAVGALSLIHKDCHAFGIYAGNPAKRIKERKKDLLHLEQQLLADITE